MRECYTPASGIGKQSFAYSTFLPVTPGLGRLEEMGGGRLRSSPTGIPARLPGNVMAFRLSPSTMPPSALDAHRRSP